MPWPVRCCWRVHKDFNGMLRNLLLTWGRKAHWEWGMWTTTWILVVTVKLGQNKHIVKILYFYQQMILIFQTLEMILLRTASDLNHFSMVGNTIVKKTVSTHMKLIQSSLHSGNHRYGFFRDINDKWHISPLLCKFCFPSMTGLFGGASVSCLPWCLRAQTQPERFSGTFNSTKAWMDLLEDEIRWLDTYNYWILMFSVSVGYFVM